MTGWDTEAQGARNLPLCLVKSGQACDAFVLDLTGDGKPEVLLVGLDRDSGTAVLGQVDGKWEALGRLPYGSSGCDALLGKLKTGEFQVVAKPVQDLQVDGQRLVIERSRPGEKPACR